MEEGRDKALCLTPREHAATIRINITPLTPLVVTEGKVARIPIYLGNYVSEWLDPSESDAHPDRYKAACTHENPARIRFSVNIDRFDHLDKYGTLLGVDCSFLCLGNNTNIRIHIAPLETHGNVARGGSIHAVVGLTIPVHY